LKCMMWLRLFSVLFFLCLFGYRAEAQVHPGIKFGVSTPDISPKDFIVTDSNDVAYYHVFVENARYGVHAGGFLQIVLGGFFLQPEIVYNSSKVDYRIDSLFSGSGGSNIFTDSYKNVDFPLIMGLKTGAVRLGLGPVGHLFLNSTSGFGDYSNEFEAFFNKLTWGWQAGLGLDFWKLHFDARYEGNFSNFGDYITFFGKRFDFDTKNNRFIASIGFSF
jgi:hypothetical protein